MEKTDKLDYHNQIERHFQELRGTPQFMLSTSDWGLISKWQLNAIPLVCVIRGLSNAFRAHEARRRRGESINSLAYCSAQVLDQWREYRKRAA